jgi:hypothetical protein
MELGTRAHYTPCEYCGSTKGYHKEGGNIDVLGFDAKRDYRKFCDSCGRYTAQEIKKVKE